MRFKENLSQLRDAKTKQSTRSGSGAYSSVGNWDHEYTDNDGDLDDDFFVKEDLAATLKKAPVPAPLLEKENNRLASLKAKLLPKEEEIPIVKPDDFLLSAYDSDDNSSAHLRYGYVELENDNKSLVSKESTHKSKVELNETASYGSDSFAEISDTSGSKKPASAPLAAAKAEGKEDEEVEDYSTFDSESKHSNHSAIRKSSVGSKTSDHTIESKSIRNYPIAEEKAGSGIAASSRHEEKFPESAGSLSSSEHSRGQTTVHSEGSTLRDLDRFYHNSMASYEAPPSNRAIQFGKPDSKSSPKSVTIDAKAIVHEVLLNSKCGLNYLNTRFLYAIQ